MSQTEPRGFINTVVYTGGNHRVICPGSGLHLWIESATGNEFRREPCSAWCGTCPAMAARRQLEALGGLLGVPKRALSVHGQTHDEARIERQ